MQIPAGRSNRGVAQGGLDEMNRRPALQTVGRVRMSQPVRANASINTGAFGCSLRLYTQA